jgi:protocatechuate 3,4-dioxygenase beta subunit
MGTDINPAGGGPGGGTGMPDAGGPPAPGAMAADAGAPPASGGNPSGGATDSGVRPGATDGGTVIRPDVDSAVPNDAGVDAAVSAMGDAGPSVGGLLPPMFPMASTCTLTGTDSAGEGPFFIHEDEVMSDPSLNRPDIRDGKPGVEMHLHYRLLDQDGMCMKPIAGVEVYTWHTDALGLYSGFNGQNPNQTYMPPPGMGFERVIENGDRFCRGMQVTNADGVASFKTVYPGWYFGRPIHIHFVALRKGSTAATSSYRSAQSHIFTTQLYFEEPFSRMIHENNAPYTMRTNVNGYTTYVRPSSSRVRPATRLEGNVVVASLNVITNSTQSRT